MHFNNICTKKLGIYFRSKLWNLKERTTTQQTAKRHWWSDYSEQYDFYRGWLIHEKKNTRATKNETNLYTRLMDSFGDSDMQLTTNITSMPSIIISSSNRISIFQSQRHSYYFYGILMNISFYSNSKLLFIRISNKRIISTVLS